MQKTVIACCVGALFAAGTAVAATHTLGDKVGIAGEGSALTVNTQTQKVTDKSQLIGGWWHYTDLVTAETDLNHAGTTSDLTVDLTNNTQVDEIVGGNYIKQPKGLTDKTHEATIGDTKLTVKAVKTEYIVAGSKANNTGKGSIVNGNTTLVIEDGIIQYEADPSKGAVVGGNYIKASSPSAGMVSQTNSTVGDTSVTINGGTFGGSVYGSSFAENYAHVDTPDMQLKLTTGNSSLQINGGTYNGHVVAGSGVTGQGTSSTAQSAAVTINAAKNKTVTLGNNSILIGGDYLANRGKSEIEGNTSVTVTGEGTITLGKGIVGGSYVAENMRGNAAASGGKYTASEIKGTTNILVDAANVTVKDEVIGGTYLRQAVKDTDKDSFVSATVGSTNLILKAGTFKSNVIAGGKSNDYTGSLSSDVLGDTSLTITGGTYEAAVLGGGSAKAGQGDASNKRDVSADVMGTARVNVTGGTLNGIVGGGLSYLYTSSALTDAVVTTHVENVAANITGGTINTMDHNSGLDGFGIPASVVGGGVAYSKSTVTTNKVEATVGNVDMTIAGKGVKLSGDIYAGGFAHGAKTAASVNSTRLTIADATLGAADSQVNVFAGGYAALGATSTVKTSEVTIANSKIFGNVYGGGNKADAQSNVTVENSVITLDGADVTGIVSTESFEPSVNAALMRLAEADTGAGDAEANKTQRTINLINSKMGTLQISAKQDTETSLYLVGSNTVGAITGGKASEIVFDGTGTPAGEAILTLTKEGASFDMSGDKDIVARNVASGTLLVDGKYKTAAETTVTLENAFGDVVYDLGKDAIDSTDLLLTDAGIVIGTGDTAQTIGASSVKVSESSKTLAEAQLGSVAFVTQGAEFVADEGMRSIRAAAKEGSFTAFGAMAGGYNRYETGSHVDVEGFSLAVGTAGRINNLTLAGFVEAGWASSESHVASTEADADHDYYGAGAAMRYDFQSPFYLDGAVRLGQISTEFDGSYGTGTAKYDADGLYATAHIGAGYVFDLTPDVKLDAYGRYLLSYVEGDDVTLESDAKERFSMDDTTTHAVRLGARLEGAFQTFDWYAGLAYEHVFDGKAEGELKFAGATAALDAPSLKGDSAIVDLGFTMKPEANGPWTIGVGLKGYAGDRRGGTGSVNVLYTF